MILSRPGRSGGDEPGVEAIGGCVHKQRALNTRLSSGTSAGTFACPAGPYAGRRTKFAPVKSLDSSEFSSEFTDLKTLTSNVKVNPVIS